MVNSSIEQVTKVLLSALFSSIYAYVDKSLGRILSNGEMQLFYFLYTVK